jgi:hypothetical protein
LLEHYPDVVPLVYEILVDVMGVVFGATVVARWVKVYIPEDVHVKVLLLNQTYFCR